MSHLPKGLTDKLYWREGPGGLYHCFKALSAGGYISLCRQLTRNRSGGQMCDRPPPLFRCGLCDGAEMRRRGWDESGPTSIGWKTPNVKVE